MIDLTDRPHVYWVTKKGDVVDCGAAEERIQHWDLDWNDQHYFLAFPILFPYEVATPAEEYEKVLTSEKIFVYDTVMGREEEETMDEEKAASMAERYPGDFIFYFDEVHDG